MAIAKYLRLIVAGGILAAVLGSAVACGGDDGGAKPTAGIQVKTPGAGSGTSGGGGGEKAESVKITLKDNLFEPKALTVPVGKSFDIELKNSGAAVHNMHILSQSKEGKDFSSNATINPGTDSKFTVKFTKAGTYNFQCDYHVPDMVGTITVQ